MKMFYCPFFQWETVFSYVHFSKETWPLHGCRSLPHLVIFRPDAEESGLFIINDKHFCYWLVIWNSVTNRKIFWFCLFQCVHRQLSIVLCCYGKWDNLNCRLQLTKGKEKLDMKKFKSKLEEDWKLFQFHIITVYCVGRDL